MFRSSLDHRQGGLYLISEATVILSTPIVCIVLVIINIFIILHGHIMKVTTILNGEINRLQTILARKQVTACCNSPNFPISICISKMAELSGLEYQLKHGYTPQHDASVVE